jgi:hypothetical protein
VGKGDITGNDRVRERDQGNALAGKSSLNRLELSGEKSDRYWRTPVVIDAVREFLVHIPIKLSNPFPCLHSKTAASVLVFNLGLCFR